MKSFPRNLILALLPGIVGLAAYISLHTAFAPVPMLVFRADLGSALMVTGALLTVIGLAAALGYEAARRSGEKRLFEAWLASAESRRRFLRRLDHELKNPLTGMRAALANLGSAEEDRDRERAFQDSRHAVERLSKLVAELRKLAELEERPIESAPVDLGEVLEEAVEAAGEMPQYAGRRVNLVISKVPWPLPPVTGDRDLLGLAFYNLVENALKYSGPDDDVEVRAVEDGRWLIVEVADAGPGIAGDDLPRIFEELFRGTNARGLEGSGLGLALVSRVIDRHGGTISVRSREAGQKGTVFRVRLPASGRGGLPVVGR